MELRFLKITNLINVLKFLTVSLLISCEIQGQPKGENPNHNFWSYLKHSEPNHFRKWYSLRVHEGDKSSTQETSFLMAWTYLNKSSAIPSHESHTKYKIIGKILWPLALWLDRAGLWRHIITESELFVCQSTKPLIEYLFLFWSTQVISRTVHIGLNVTINDDRRLSILFWDKFLTGMSHLHSLGMYLMSSRSVRCSRMV